MSLEDFTIPKASNKEIINFFVEVIDVFELPDFQYSILGSHSSYTFNKSSKISESVARPDHFSIISASIIINEYTIKFGRGSREQQPNIAFDHISIGRNSYSSNSWRPNQDQIVNLNSLIYKHFEAKKKHASFLFNDPKAFESVISSHQLILAKLEDSLSSVGERLVEARAKIEDEFRIARENLEEQHRSRTERLEASELELEARRKALDDRDNTHARRQIRSDLKKRIEDHATTFRLTAGTRTLRLPIHVLTWIGLAVLGAATYYFSADINHMVSEAAARDKAIGATEVVVLALKPLGLTVAFLGLLTWYLRWMNRWFERHSEAEFQLKQFELDVDRASWVVETALEWRQEQQAPMPDHLIESISRNLFSRSEKDEAADMHPADYLASALLGRASGLKLKLPGADLEYDGKALKEARQTADKARP
ncbi:hypothetical protein [Azospirillum cavernae]|nr:hypothetical protein [Azospirillum cavernae]